MQIYDNRKNLSATLKDTKTIVGKLERLLGICFQLLFIFFYLAIFDVSSTMHALNHLQHLYKIFLCTCVLCQGAHALREC